MKKIFGFAENRLGLSKDLVGFLFQLCHGSEETYGHQKHIHLIQNLCYTKLMLLSLFECKISTVWAHSQDFCMILYKKTVFLDKGQEASLGLPDSLPFSLQTRLIIATSPEVGHEQEHTDEGDDDGQQNPPLAECVVKSMHECRDGHGEEIERMTVTRI